LKKFSELKFAGFVAAFNNWMQ